MIRKRQFVVVAMCLLIVAGAYITNKNGPSAQTVMNQTLDDPSPSPKVYGEAQFVNGGTEDYVSQARLNRDTARGETLDLLRETAEQSETEEVVQTMTRIATAIEQESKLENELKAKGFGDAVVFITDAGATVTLSSNGFKEEELAKIFSTVMAETGLNTDKIKIIEIK